MNCSRALVLQASRCKILGPPAVNPHGAQQNYEHMSCLIPRTRGIQIVSALSIKLSQGGMDLRAIGQGFSFPVALGKTAPSPADL
jgi:hypothetical protein